MMSIALNTLQPVLPAKKALKYSAIWKFAQMLRGVYPHHLEVVVTGRTFAREISDIPGQQQRFARARGLRDAEDRASKVIAEHIRSRLASYFVTGT